jgi:acetylornithine deacetylase/succinyl-diaminopimelate desuccinylase-like protein
MSTNRMVARWLKDHQRELISSLEEAVRIPSISTDPGYADQLNDSARFFARLAERSGFQRVEIWDSAGAPVVYAERIENPKLPSILVYAHHDVQPAGSLDDWDTPPFEPVTLGNELRGRGAADDKQHIVMHCQAVEALLAVDTHLPINLGLLLDGDEESGSVSFLKEFQRHRQELSSDVLVVSGRMLSPQQPTLNVGVRGLVYLEVELEVMPRDLHSGLYGGAAPNATHVLSEVVAQLHDAEGRVAVPGFYDRVRAPTSDERNVLASCQFDAQAFLGLGGVRYPVGEAGWNVLERRTVRPTLDVCGLSGGYFGVGAKTIIPARCSAKISARLVPNQDPHEIAELIREHITNLAPANVAMAVNSVVEAPWVRTPIHHPAVLAAGSALRRTWKTEPILSLEGGSIPPVASLVKDLGTTCILFGVLLPDDNAHGPNERLLLEQLYRGVEATTDLWRQLGHLDQEELHYANS